MLAGKLDVCFTCLSRKKWLETTEMGLGVGGRGKPI